jgi:hypothetical protein
MPNQSQAFPPAKFEGDVLDGEEFAVPKPLAIPPISIFSEDFTDFRRCRI